MELARRCGLLERVYVFSTAITDDGIITLAECCSNLELVYFTGCNRVTDIGLTALVESHPEVLVWSEDTGVSPQCIVSLKERFPRAQI